LVTIKHLILVSWCIILPSSSFLHRSSPALTNNRYRGVTTTTYYTNSNYHHSIISSKKMSSSDASNNKTNGSYKYLTPISRSEVTLELKDPVDSMALSQATAIFNELTTSPSSTTSTSSDNDNTGGRQPVDPASLMKVAQRLGDIAEGSESYIASSEDCKTAFEGLDDVEREALVNIHDRVKRFADMQRRSVVDAEMDIPGGKAGHTVSPCKAAGCYAPGGRYPLPSSVIMTAVTARAAGCQTVILASPRPAKITLAAAHVCNVDTFLCVGGAQAIATMAYGITDSNHHGPSIPKCDVIVGPGNKWVTAAKSMVQGYCGIDMLAGPSEVLVLCDQTANAEVVAADLIAQAEHDVVARAILVTDDQNTVERVEAEVARQIDTLPEPNRSTAKEAFTNSFAVLCENIDQCVEVTDDIAPEHLEIQTRDAMTVGKRCSNYGGLFVGEYAAEVLGDYGAGPNHTLPTGGTGRYTGGLSVFNFLSIRTWMRIDNKQDSQKMVNESVTMARLEGLEGHARAAEARSMTVTPAYNTKST